MVPPALLDAPGDAVIAVKPAWRIRLRTGVSPDVANVLRMPAGLQERRPSSPPA